MTFTIQNIHPYDEFSFYLVVQQITPSFRLDVELNKTRVIINLAGFDQSLENLKALIVGNEIPYMSIDS